MGYMKSIVIKSSRLETCSETCSDEDEDLKNHYAGLFTCTSLMWTN